MMAKITHFRSLDFGEGYDFPYEYFFFGRFSEEGREVTCLSFGLLGLVYGGSWTVLITSRVFLHLYKVESAF